LRLAGALHLKVLEWGVSSLTLRERGFDVIPLSPPPPPQLIAYTRACPA